MVESQSTPLSSQQLMDLGLEQEAEQRRREEVAQQQAQQLLMEDIQGESLRKQAEQARITKSIQELTPDSPEAQQAVMQQQVIQQTPYDVNQGTITQPTQQELDIRRRELERLQPQLEAETGKGLYGSLFPTVKSFVTGEQSASQDVRRIQQVQQQRDEQYLRIAGRRPGLDKTSYSQIEQRGKEELKRIQRESAIKAGLDVATTLVAPGVSKFTGTAGRVLASPVSRVPVIGGVTEGLLSTTGRVLTGKGLQRVYSGVNERIRNYELPAKLQGKSLQSYLTQTKELANQRVTEQRPNLLSSVGFEVAPFLERYEKPFKAETRKILRQQGFPEKDIDLLTEEVWRQQLGSYGTELYGALGAEALANVLGGQAVGRRIKKLGTEKVAQYTGIGRGLRLVPAYITPGAAEGASGVLASQLARGRPGATKTDRVKEIIGGAAFGAATASLFGLGLESFGGTTTRGGKKVLKSPIKRKATELAGFVGDPLEYPGDVVTPFYYRGRRARVFTPSITKTKTNTLTKTGAFTQSDINKVGELTGVKTSTTTPSTVPSTVPSNVPSNVPSTVISNVPSTVPSFVPSTVPSEVPSEVPSTVPSTVITGKLPFFGLPPGFRKGGFGFGKKSNKKVIKNLVGGLFSKKKSVKKKRVKKKNPLKGKI